MVRTHKEIDRNICFIEGNSVATLLSVDLAHALWIMPCVSYISDFTNCKLHTMYYFFLHFIPCGFCKVRCSGE